MSFCNWINCLGVTKWIRLLLIDWRILFQVSGIMAAVNDPDSAGKIYEAYGFVWFDWKLWFYINNLTFCNDCSNEFVCFDRKLLFHRNNLTFCNDWSNEFVCFDWKNVYLLWKRSKICSIEFKKGFNKKFIFSNENRKMLIQYFQWLVLFISSDSKYF